MRFDQPEVLAPEQRPLAERAYVRDHVRHEVAVAGYIVGRAGRMFPARVVDISSSGLALDVDYGLVDTVTPGLEKDMHALVRLPHPGGEAETWIAAEVRVMWCRKNLVGVRFEHPDGLLYRTLQGFVSAAVEARAAAMATHEKHAEAARRNRLRATRKLLQQALPSMIWILRTALVNHLRLAAKQVPAALEDAALLEAKSAAITRTIEHEFLIGFALLCDLDCTQELSMAQLRAARAEAERPDALPGARDERMASLVAAAEDRCRPALRTFAGAVHAVLGYAVDPLHNPLAPATLCPAVWDAFLAQCRSPRVEHELAQILVRDFAPALAKLLEDLARDLAANAPASA